MPPDDQALRGALTALAVGVMIAIKPYIGGWLRAGGYRAGRIVGSLLRQLRRQ